MIAPLSSSTINALLGLEVGPTDPGVSNRCLLDGITVGSRHDGVLEIGIQSLEAASLRLASGPLTLELGRIALHKLVAQLRMDAGRLRLCSLEAADAELSGVKLHGPAIVSLQPKAEQQVSPGQDGAPPAADTTAGQVAAEAWCLGPLSAADGTIRGEIIDAHLLFDADVTVPIRQGQINFNDATVEHVGPDSRMGVSRLGIYVDAPNGRSYLYEFASAPLAGVAFERRGALLGPWVTERGSLSLQAFGEATLRQARDGQGLGFTEQARLLLGRTALSGDVRLSDGRFAVPGVQAHLVGRSDGRNEVRLRSEAVGRGLTVELDSLSLQDAVLNRRRKQLGCDKLTARLMLRLFVADAQLRLAVELDNMKISGLRLHVRRPEARDAFNRGDASRRQIV